MSHSGHYLPRTDAGLLAWSANFSDLIVASPTDYGLTIEDATDYATLHTTYADAYAAAHGPGRGPAATQTKNTAKAALMQDARRLVRIIQAFPGTTNTMRVQLNITVPDEPTPVPSPAYAPEMDMLPVVGRTVKIRVHNEQTLGHRGKPHGVKAVAVYSYVGENAPDDIHEWKAEALSSRPAVDIEFPPTLAPGTKVWLTAYWLNTKMESGPACQPQGVNLAGGVSKAA